MAEKEHLSNLVFAWGGDESAIPESEVEAFPDETRSPLLNELIRIARKYVAGVSGAQDFVWSMQKTMPALRMCLFHHKEMVHHLDLDEDQADLAQEADKALFRLLEALGEMVASFTKEDLPRVEDGIEYCKQSAEVLEAWHAELAILERREYGTVCNACGHYAQPLQSSCLFCHSDLVPPDEAYEPEKDWVVTPNPYFKLYQGLLATITQAAPPEPWLVLVDHLAAGFSSLKKSVGAYSLEDDVTELKPELTDQLFELLKAIDVSQVSLRVFQKFPVHQDLGAVDEAWYRLLNAVPVLHHHAFSCRHDLVEQLEYVSSEEFAELLEAKVEGH